MRRSYNFFPQEVSLSFHTYGMKKIFLHFFFTRSHLRVKSGHWKILKFIEWIIFLFYSVEVLNLWKWFALIFSHDVVTLPISHGESNLSLVLWFHTYIWRQRVLEPLTYCLLLQLLGISVLSPTLSFSLFILMPLTFAYTPINGKVFNHFPTLSLTLAII